MQFPNPIVRALIIYDNNGNPVVIIGPGPIIRVINPATNREISIEPGITNPAIFWWNAAHTDNSFINTSGDTIFGVNGFSFVSNMVGTPTLRGRIIFGPNGNIMHMVNGAQQGRGGYVDVNTVRAELGWLDNVTGASQGYVSADNNGVNLGSSANGRTINYNKSSGFLSTGGTSQQWTNMNLFNGWTNRPGWYPLQFRDGLDESVEFRGAINAGTTTDATSVANFPITGYLPPAVQYMAIGTFGTPNACSIQYNTDGILYFRCSTPSAPTFIDLTGVRGYRT